VEEIPYEDTDEDLDERDGDAHARRRSPRGTRARSRSRRWRRDFPSPLRGGARYERSSYGPAWPRRSYQPLAGWLATSDTDGRASSPLVILIRR
jgi:hypothetical protein